MQRSDDDRYLDKLSQAKGAAYNSRRLEHMPCCLQDTRVALLREIQEWWESPTEVPCVYWLNGMAGTGKSTIARTVADKCAKQQQLGASFFFARGDEEYLAKSDKFFTTLAAQLASTIPGLKPSICKAIKETPDINDRLLSEQWNKLILDPLSKLNEQTPRIIVFVIDALDECRGNKDIKQILTLLSQASNLSNIRLRIFVTSRPENHIGLGFAKLLESTRKKFKLQDVSDKVVEQDIFLYMKHGLGLMRDERLMRDTRSLPSDWPGDDVLQLLARRSAGLFIYAATICRFLEDQDFNPHKRLDRLLEGGTNEQSATETLDEIYTQILTTSILEGRKERDIEEISERFKRVVGSILAIFSPLPQTALTSLLGEDKIETQATLDSLRSILDVPETTNNSRAIRLLHQSFRDFLLDPQRCSDSRLQVDEQRTHGELLSDCLRCLSNTLMQDICNLRHPGALTAEVDKIRLENALPTYVQYACRYWIYHLGQSGIVLRDNDKVHEFLKKYFLRWLEALSLLGNLSEGIRAFEVLDFIIAVNIPQTGNVPISNRC